MIPLLSLPPDEVHVWTIAFDQPPGVMARLEAVLSPEERTRGNRFLSAKDRVLFVAAHGALRDILGSYLGREPADIGLEEGSRGKPRMREEEDHWLKFNLSHTRGRALVAVARDRVVGVDIEHLERDTDHAGVVAHFFSPTEQAAWTALPDAGRAAGFFRLWTAKEAYVKARGDGLEHPSSRYTMSLASDQEGALLVDELSPEAPGHWTVQALPVDGGYVASLASAGDRPRVVMHAWHAAGLEI